MLSDTDQERVQNLTEPYRREIQLHCYRLLGSLHDAEGLVQETFLRTWRALDSFEGRTSFRNWLYRIATNVCLNARRANARRVLPETRVRNPAAHAPGPRDRLADQLRGCTALHCLRSPAVLPAQDVPLRSATAAALQQAK